jgi:hypothetical protein
MEGFKHKHLGEHALGRALSMSAAKDIRVLISNVALAIGRSHSY